MTDRNDFKQYVIAQRRGLLKQVDSAEAFLGLPRTVALRKKYTKLQAQFDTIKAWAKTKGHILPTE